MAKKSKTERLWKTTQILKTTKQKNLAVIADNKLLWFELHAAAFRKNNGLSICLKNIHKPSS